VKLPQFQKWKRAENPSARLLRTGASLRHSNPFMAPSTVGEAAELLLVEQDRRANLAKVVLARAAARGFSGGLNRRQEQGD
jgi:hypothetical protein